MAMQRALGADAGRRCWFGIRGESQWDFEAQAEQDDARNGDEQRAHRAGAPPGSREEPGQTEPGADQRRQRAGPEHEHHDQCRRNAAGSGRRGNERVEPAARNERRGKTEKQGAGQRRKASKPRERTAEKRTETRGRATPERDEALAGDERCDTPAVRHTPLLDQLASWSIVEGRGGERG